MIVYVVIVYIDWVSGTTYIDSIWKEKTDAKDRLKIIGTTRGEIENHEVNE